MLTTVAVRNAVIVHETDGENQSVGVVVKYLYTKTTVIKDVNLYSTNTFRLNLYYVSKNSFVHTMIFILLYASGRSV